MPFFESEPPSEAPSIPVPADMIGGSTAIVSSLETDSQKCLGLSFHPDDPTAGTIPSHSKPAANVLLRISVPKRTGRKRKRGSDEPFIGNSSANTSVQDAAYLRRSMVDNQNSYRVTALTNISKMHVWRNMPDHVYSTTGVKLVDDVKTKLLSQQYSLIKTFDLPRTYGLQDTQMLPPPIWSSESVPRQYMYRQNPSAKIITDVQTGEKTMTNSQPKTKVYCYQCQWDTEPYPTEPMPDIPPLEKQSDIFKITVAEIRRLFDIRPIYTRRALFNSLETSLTSDNLARYAVGYVAFAVRSGPWRDTYVKLGVDPRRDSKCRIYQTIMVQLVTRNKERRQHHTTQADEEDMGHNANVNAHKQRSITQDEQGRRNLKDQHPRVWRRLDRSVARMHHIFDGKSEIPPDGKVWQLCDMTDSDLVSLRDVPESEVRQVCEERYFGWYTNGTNAKLRVVFKAKVDAIQDGIPYDQRDLDDFLKLPNIVERYMVEGDEQSNFTAAEISKMTGRKPSPQMLSWTATFRSFARTEYASRNHTSERTTGKSRPKIMPKRKVIVGPEAEDEQEQEQEEAGSRIGDTLSIAGDESDMVDAGPEHVEGEVIMPSIEGMIDEDDEELDLDVDIKEESSGEE